MDPFDVPSQPNLTGDPSRLWCRVHGWMRHTTAECKNIPLSHQRSRQTMAPPPTWPSVPSASSYALASSPNNSSTMPVASAPVISRMAPPSTPPAPPRSFAKCIYCGQFDHPRWRCPKVTKKKKHYCFLCGEMTDPPHDPWDCTKYEFDQEVIDLNHARFKKAQEDKVQFVPIQHESPMVYAKAKDGHLKDTTLDIIKKHVPKPRIMTQGEDSISFKFKSSQDANVAFQILERITDVEVTSSWPLKQSQRPVHIELDPEAQPLHSTAVVIQPVHEVMQTHDLKDHPRFIAIEKELQSLKQFQFDATEAMRQLQGAANQQTQLLNDLIQRLPPLALPPAATLPDSSHPDDPLSEHNAPSHVHRPPKHPKTDE